MEKSGHGGAERQDLESTVLSDARVETRKERAVWSLLAIKNKEARTVVGAGEEKLH